MKAIHSIVILAAAGLFAACQTTHNAKPNRFDLADVNHDGSLSRGEVSDRLVTEVFEGRDTKKNGKLTKAEWMLAGDDKWNKVFSQADANHDGVVTLEELKAVGRKKGIGSDFFTKADKNRDGALSREETRAYYASKEGPAW
jgi:Ca2+-binding EF-hand superfamily protein